MESKDIHRIEIEGKEIILIGTAHISKESAETVKNTIEEEKPDSVCIELDSQRYKSLTEKDSWEKMDIVSVIKQKKAAFLLANLIMSSFQKRMAKQFGIDPGQEMIQAIETAKETGANLVLADRNIQVTFTRVWRNLSGGGKIKLIGILLGSLFSNEKITEEELAQLKTGDQLSSMLAELSKSFPDLKEPLIDERDTYLAQKIREAPGEKVVAVVGAGHIPGIKEKIKENQDLNAISQVPPKKKRAKWFLWIIPVLIVTLVVITFFTNRDAVKGQLISWIVWNGSLSALGALIALGHPLSILTAFVAAPLTSINPLIGAGWFSGLVEAILRKPKVEDFKNLSDDVLTVKGFWKNKITRILLVFLFSSIGSSIGTFVAGSEIVRLFFQSF